MSQPQQYHSYLFTIRLWTERTDAGQVEYRGRVQHVLSGEMRYFRDWESLTTFLMEQADNGSVDNKQADNGQEIGDSFQGSLSNTSSFNEDKE